MLELMFSLSDDDLAEITLHNYRTLENMCIGLTLELHQIETLAKSYKHLS